ARKLFRHARREAWIVLGVWAVSLVWAVGYCYLYGYQHSADSCVVQWGLVSPRTPADFAMIAGMPDWVFFGILVPWLLCTAFTFGFCFYMKDDDLGGEAEEGHGHGH